MAERAHVTSVEALESFRASLIIYLSKARPTLDEIGAEVLRTRLWMENDRRTFWEAQVRRRAKALEQAQQALFSARVSNLRQETSAELMAVHRAKRALEEAEAKLRILKQWNREFDSRVEPLSKELQKLNTILAVDMLHAVAHLGQVLNTLDAYAGITPTAASTAPPPSGTKPAPEAGASPSSDAAAENVSKGGHS